MATQRPTAVVTSASAIPPATAPRPVAFCSEMPLNGFRMPTTVPNRPTKGAVEPMVARPLRPRLSSACTMASARSRARLEASICSPGMSPDSEWARNSCRPAVTTLARWLFLLRSATRVASSILPSRSAPATAGAKARDCLRAALNAIQRSIITPMDQPDMMNRMITTAFARIPIWCHSEIGSQPTVPPSWKIQDAYTEAWVRAALAACATNMSDFSSSGMSYLDIANCSKPALQAITKNQAWDLLCEACARVLDSGAARRVGGLQSTRPGTKKHVGANRLIQTGAGPLGLAPGKNSF